MSARDAKHRPSGEMRDRFDDRGTARASAARDNRNPDRENTRRELPIGP